MPARDAWEEGEQSGRARERTKRMSQAAKSIGALGHGLRITAFRRCGVEITLRAARGILYAADLQLRKLKRERTCAKELLEAVLARGNLLKGRLCLFELGVVFVFDGDFARGDVGGIGDVGNFVALFRAEGAEALVDVVEIAKIFLPVRVLANRVQRAKEVALPVGIRAREDVGELADLFKAVAVTVVDFAEVGAAEIAGIGFGKIVVGVDLFTGIGRFGVGARGWLGGIIGWRGFERSVLRSWSGALILGGEGKSRGE